MIDWCDWLLDLDLIDWLIFYLRSEPKNWSGGGGVGRVGTPSYPVINKAGVRSNIEPDGGPRDLEPQEHSTTDSPAARPSPALTQCLLTLGLLAATVSMTTFSCRVTWWRRLSTSLLGATVVFYSTWLTALHSMFLLAAWVCFGLVFLGAGETHGTGKTTVAIFGALFEGCAVLFCSLRFLYNYPVQLYRFAEWQFALSAGWIRCFWNNCWFRWLQVTLGDPNRVCIDCSFY